MNLANNYIMENLTKKTMGLSRGAVKLNFHIKCLTWVVTILAFFTLVASVINIVRF